MSPTSFFFSCYKRSGLPSTQAAPSEQGQRPCGEEAARRSHASVPYPERGSPPSERPQAARAQLRFPARPGRARAPIAAVASRSQGPASAGEKGATATAAPPPGSEEWKEERRRHRGRPHAVRRSPGCSPCGRQAVGPLAKALRDPTARQRVGRGRPAPSRPGWAGPGRARRLGLLLLQRAAAANSLRRPPRQPRAPHSPGGCWCSPWAPPGRPARSALQSPFKSPAHGRPARANGALASSVRDVTHNNAPPAVGGTSVQPANSLVLLPATHAQARTERLPSASAHRQCEHAQLLWGCCWLHFLPG